MPLKDISNTPPRSRQGPPGKSKQVAWSVPRPRRSASAIFDCAFETSAAGLVNPASAAPNASARTVTFMGKRGVAAGE